MAQTFITNPLTKRYINSTSRTAKKVYSLCKSGHLTCSDKDMAILEKLFGPKKPEIAHPVDFPELPLCIIENILHIADDTCREYCRNRLMCKGINIGPLQFKFDGSDDADDYFDYIVGKYTIGQMKDPTSDEEIASAEQFAAFFDAVMEKHSHCLKIGANVLKTRRDRAVWICLWIQKMTTSRLIINNFRVFYDHLNPATEVSDSDSLRKVKEKLIAYITPHTVHTYSNRGIFTLSVWK